MTAPKIIDAVQRGGGFLLLEGDNVRAKAPPAVLEAFRSLLREHKGEILDELRRRASPRIDAYGDLVIPFGASPESMWWTSEGRSLLATLVGLDAAPEVIRRYLDFPKLDWLEERAAILEHEANMTRPEAEREAIRQLAERMPR